MDDRLNVPERTAATTPADNLAVVAAAVARGDRMTCTPRAPQAAQVSVPKKKQRNAQEAEATKVNMERPPRS